MAEKTKEISFGRKVLEWVPLIGAPFSFTRRKYTKFEKEHRGITGLKHLYTALNLVLDLLLVGNGLWSGMWTPKHYREFFEEKRMEQQHNQKVETQYENTKNYYLDSNSIKLDTFNFYNQNKYFRKAIVFDESRLTTEDKEEGSRESFHKRCLPKSIDSSLVE